MTTCDQVDPGIIRHDIAITVTDYENREAKLKIDAVHLMYDGSEFEDPNYCYVAIFESKYRQKDSITLGQAYFDHAYVSFDASPVMLEGKLRNKILVGVSQ